jgi:hypothetical protein
LPIAEIVTSNSTEHRAALPYPSPPRRAQTFLGEYGGKLVAVAFMIRRVQR